MNSVLDDYFPDSKGNVGVIIGSSLRWLVFLVVVIAFVSYYIKTISSK